MKAGVSVEKFAGALRERFYTQRIAIADSAVKLLDLRLQPEWGFDQTP
jgi:hypothetical protein